MFSGTTGVWRLPGGWKTAIAVLEEQGLCLRLWQWGLGWVLSRAPGCGARGACGSGSCSPVRRLASFEWVWGLGSWCLESPETQAAFLLPQGRSAPLWLACGVVCISQSREVLSAPWGLMRAHRPFGWGVQVRDIRFWVQFVSDPDQCVHLLCVSVSPCPLGLPIFGHGCPI